MLHKLEAVFGVEDALQVGTATVTVLVAFTVTFLVHKVHTGTVIDTEKPCNPQGSQTLMGGSISTHHCWLRGTCHHPIGGYRAEASKRKVHCGSGKFMSSALLWQDCTSIAHGYNMARAGASSLYKASLLCTWKTHLSLPCWIGVSMRCGPATVMHSCLAWKRRATCV